MNNEDYVEIGKKRLFVLLEWRRAQSNGREVDTEDGGVSVPLTKVAGPGTTILPDVYRPGRALAKLRDAQVIRAICQHWITGSLYRKLPIHSLDRLIRYADEGDNFTSRHEPDIWVAFRDSSRFCE